MLLEEKPWFKSWPDGVKKTFTHGARDYPGITLIDHFERTVKKKPDMVYLTFSGIHYTFREVDELSNRFASVLNEHGIKKNDRIAIFMPNLPQFVIAFYGGLKAGAIVVPCNPVYGSKDLKFQLNDAGVSIIVVLDLLYETLKVIRDDCPELKHVIIASVGELFSPVKRFLGRLAGKLPKSPPVKDTDPKFMQLLKNTQPTKLNIDFDPVEDIVLLQYTGGTTGKPKGAMLTHHNLIANLQQAHEWLIEYVEEDESFVGALPFFHLFGLMTIMLAAVQFEATIHLVPDPRNFKMIFEVIHKEKPAYFHGVPTLYLALLNSPLFKNYDLSSLKFCLSGAAPLPVQLANDFESATGGDTIIVEGYGMTELSPIATINPADKETRKVGSVGLPVTDTDIKIIDPDRMKELPPGEIGEIAVSGPQVMKGYWNKPDETSFALREFDGLTYMFTGDLGYMDEDGFFFVADRIKDMINVSGYKVFPREVEEVLFTHPSIVEAAVVGVPDDYRGETVKVFIVTKEGTGLSQKDLYEFCKGKIAKYKIPRVLEIRDSLPLTAVGKVYRKGLRDEEKSDK